MDTATGGLKPGTMEPTPSQAQTVSDLARSFGALGEAKRLQILNALASGEQCACDLTGCCGDRQPLLSFHLKRLRETGLVRARKEGRWMHYALDREALRGLAAALNRLANGNVDPGQGCCD